MDQIFESLHLTLYFLISLPNDEAVIPFPREETTPPVTKIYFVIICYPPLKMSLHVAYS